jgi:adenylate cyclase
MTWTRYVPGRGRALSYNAGALLILVLAVTLQYFEPLRSSVFNLYQSFYPRIRRAAPSVIVAIDEESLRLHGQWPWPRTWLARLVDLLAEAHPAAIGIDLVMPEPDRLSPGRLVEFVPGIKPELARHLSTLQSNDAILAQALSGRPIVLGVAGLERDPGRPAQPLRPALHTIGGDPRRFAVHYGATLRSVEEIGRVANGHGLLNFEAERRVVRRMPLVAAAGDAMLASFAVEILRVATGAPLITLRVGASGIEAVGIGNVLVPTQPDGSVLLHFSRSDPSRFVSAADVLAGTVERRIFEKKLILIGVTALGLSDFQATPVSDRMSGVEIHAQLLESIFEGALLSRPGSLAWIELGAMLLVGVTMLWVVDQVGVWMSLSIGVAFIALLVGIPVWLFGSYRVLLDPLPAIFCVVGLLGQQSLVKLNRLGRLRRFFSPQLARLIIEGGGIDPLDSHRREVTVVFLDLRDFTGFAETADPEEVMAVLREYQTEMGRLILEYEGTLERFTGDGMMIFFNDPVPVPNAAERAVRMAAAMRACFHQLDVAWRQRGYNLGFGVGIAQGYATLGAIGFEGRWDYAAIGTVTNLAARLCGEAQSGQILISQGLAAVVHHLASLDILAPITLKGFARPVPVFNVLTLKS